MVTTVACRNCEKCFSQRVVSDLEGEQHKFDAVVKLKRALCTSDGMPPVLPTLNKTGVSRKAPLCSSQLTGSCGSV